MQIFDYDGNATFEGVWGTLTSAKSFPTDLLNIPRGATHWLRYSNGATAALATGETITGETSSATATLVGQAIDSGTAGAGDVGIVFLKNVSGTFQAETIHGDTTDGHIDVIQAPIALRRQMTNPKAVIVSVEDFDVTVSFTGTIPTVYAGTNNGIILVVGQNWVIRGVNNIKNFQAINTVNASGSILKYVLYF
jgi:hypothetical protein